MVIEDEKVVSTLRISALTRVLLVQRSLAAALSQEVPDHGAARSAAADA